MVEITDPTATLIAIWSKRAKRGPMDPIERTQLLVGGGLIDDANQSRKRQVTVLSSERWADVQSELGQTLDPSARRANLMVRGLELANSRGRVLRVGSCRLLVGGETLPCRKMDQRLPGLRAALGPDWRGGIYAEVLDAGWIQIGDEVSWDDPSSGE